MIVREAAVAGGFYPKEEAQLIKRLGSFFKGASKEKKSCCVIAPHAGYIYSGRIAACSFGALRKADTFMVLSPNHTGLGEMISVSDADFWETPLGRVAVDRGLRQVILEKLGIKADGVAHVQEHSCEVQIPFLQFLFPEAKVLPITLMAQELSALEKLGSVLFEACGGKNIGVIASSDFSHFVEENEAKKKDLAAIRLIEKIDFAGFHSLVMRQNLSICGFSPITALLVFCKKKGLKKGRLLKYGTSATVTKDKSSVVGYAAIKFE
jgi:hypothetical protein